jgi:nucleotide-binding universal stress UspA family protein
MMPRRFILLAVGDCVYSQQAVKYAARISSAAKDVTYTLFNVHPLAPHIFIEEAKADSWVKAEVDALIRENAKAARRAVGEFKDLMVREGIPEERVEVVTEPVQEGMAKDILNRAEQGFYDAILLARRGLTPSRDFFIGTIAAKERDSGVWHHPLGFLAAGTVSMNPNP